MIYPPTCHALPCPPRCHRASHQVLCFDHDTPIGSLLEGLSRLQVLSAPVVVRSGRPGSNQPASYGGSAGCGVASEMPSVRSIAGFVSVQDVLDAFLTGAA